jgi:hypothetical protein
MYTDEHKSAEVHHEAAVIIRAGNAAILQESLQKIALQAFPEQAQNQWLDLHASPMWHRNHEKKGWKTDWSAIGEDEMFEFFKSACALINDLSEQVYVQRLRLSGTENAYYKDHERYYAIRFLLHRLDELAATSKGSALAFCDEESDHRVQREIQLNLQTYITTKQRTRYNPPIAQTLLPVHFVDSTHSVGVQAADIVAFVYGRFLANQKNRRPDFDQIKELVTFLSKLEKSKPWPYR